MIVSFLEDCLIYLAVFITSAYIYVKALQIKLNLRRVLQLCISAVALSVLPVLLKDEIAIYPRFIFIILTCLVLILLKRLSLYTSVPTAVISMGLSYCFQFIITTAFTAILFIFGIVKPDTFFISGIAVLQIAATVLFMRIKRFRAGFSFLQDANNFGLGLLISGIVFALITVVGQLNNDNRSAIILIVIGVFVSTVGLIIWIYSALTKSYIAKLQKRQDEKRIFELSEKDKYIDELKRTNAFLSGIVHRDNHLISSLKYSISEYFGDEDTEHKDVVLKELLKLAEERNDLILKEQVKNKVLPSTGIALIDGALTDMYVKASAHNIEFNLIVLGDIHYLVNNFISQTDLHTLLCDHIKNAVIAVDESDIEKKRILVVISKQNGEYTISIKDNGKQFPVEILKRLGIERVTSRKDKGGNGIGFETTFDTMKKSGFSIILTEHYSGEYSKSLDFRFDNKREFVINTSRYEKFGDNLGRDDVRVNLI